MARKTSTPKQLFGVVTNRALEPIPSKKRKDSVSGETFPDRETASTRIHDQSARTLFISNIPRNFNIFVLTGQEPVLTKGLNSMEFDKPSSRTCTLFYFTVEDAEAALSISVKALNKKYHLNLAISRDGPKRTEKKIAQHAQNELREISSDWPLSEDPTPAKINTKRTSNEPSTPEPMTIRPKKIPIRRCYSFARPIPPPPKPSKPSRKRKADDMDPDFPPQKKSKKAAPEPERRTDMRKQLLPLTKSALRKLEASQQPPVIKRRGGDMDERGVERIIEDSEPESPSRSYGFEYEMSIGTISSEAGAG